MIVGLDRIDVPASGNAIIPIASISRLNGLTGNIDLTVESSDGITGKLTVPAGVNATPAAPIYLPISAGAKLKPGAYAASVVATAMIDGKSVSRVATMFDLTRTAMGGMPNPPAEFTSPVAIAVTPTASFSLEIQAPTVDVPRDSTWKGKVTVTRAKDFDGEITLAAVSMPAGITPKFKPIPKGANEVELELTVTPTAPLGANSIVLKGTAKVKGKDASAIATPIMMTIVDAKKKGK